MPLAAVCDLQSWLLKLADVPFAYESLIVVARVGFTRLGPWSWCCKANSGDDVLLVVALHGLGAYNASTHALKSSWVGSTVPAREGVALGKLLPDLLPLRRSRDVSEWGWHHNCGAPAPQPPAHVLGRCQGLGGDLLFSGWGDPLAKIICFPQSLPTPFQWPS
ncbi:hypothetical protein DSO57_1021463 [Entomophthora muscae]|uniref:Uncharacterized protein n=1 Tax=Entomophthora muscae TaxID=34485 RepID=A0ACC2TE74_9FUNG|nr:hypothetical protein DSO57_1021463 [Entomophthora muscae]